MVTLFGIFNEQVAYIVLVVLTVASAALAFIGIIGGIIAERRHRYDLAVIFCWFEAIGLMGVFFFSLLAGCFKN